jgi:hypothetical protein
MDALRLVAVRALLEIGKAQGVVGAPVTLTGVRNLSFGDSHGSFPFVFEEPPQRRQPRVDLRFV